MCAAVSHTTIEVVFIIALIVFAATAIVSAVLHNVTVALIAAGLAVLSLGWVLVYVK